MKVMKSPGLRPMRAAMRTPIITPSSVNSSSEPALMLLLTRCARAGSATRIPRIKAGPATPLAVASAWPCTIGAAATTFAQAANAAHQHLVVRDRGRRPGIERDMAVEAEDAAEQLGPEPFITDMTMISVATPSAMRAARSRR